MSRHLTADRESRFVAAALGIPGLIDVGLGLCLLVAPRSLLSGVGLDAPSPLFYSRVLGAQVAAMGAVALLAMGDPRGRRSLVALSGVTRLATAAVLLAAAPGRGEWLLRLLAAGELAGGVAHLAIAAKSLQNDRGA